jgi:uncharacterized protein (TIGR03437 family)
MMKSHLRAVALLALLGAFASPFPKVVIAFSPNRITHESHPAADFTSGKTRSAKNAKSALTTPWRQPEALRGRTIFALHNKAEDLFGAADDGRVYRFANQGENWEELNVDGTFADMTFLTATETDLLAGSDGDGVFRWSDQAQFWEPVGEDLPRAKVRALAVRGTDLFAALDGEGVFRLADREESWKPINGGLPDSSVLALAAVNGDLFAGTDGDGVYRLSEEAAEWEEFSDGLFEKHVFALVAGEAGLFAGLDGGNVYLLPNDEVRWDFTKLYFKTRAEITALFLQGTDIFAGTRDGEVYLTTDQGRNWDQVNDGLRSKVLALAVSDETLVVGTESEGVFLSDLNAHPVACVSAASFGEDTLARASIVAAFGESLATATQIASQLPLPTSLAGTTVRVTDRDGNERPAPLFFVSPQQINYQLPEETADGRATVRITTEGGQVSFGMIQVVSVSPGLFTFNGTGQGVPAGYALRVRAGGVQQNEPIARFDTAQGRFVPVAIDLGPASDQLFLILFGSGLRFRGSLTAAAATIGGAGAEVLYAGPAEGFVGLDQVNLRIPRSLAGRGDVDLALTVDDQAAPPTRINIK